MNVFSGNVSSLPLEPVGLDLSSSEATCANLAGPLLQNTGSSQEAVSSHSAGMNRETQPETSLGQLLVLEWPGGSVSQVPPFPWWFQQPCLPEPLPIPWAGGSCLFNVSLSVSACVRVPYDWRLCLLTQCTGLVLLWPYFSLDMLLLSENCFSVSPLFPVESRVLIWGLCNLSAIL